MEDADSVLVRRHEDACHRVLSRHATAVMATAANASGERWDLVIFVRLQTEIK